MAIIDEKTTVRKVISGEADSDRLLFDWAIGTTFRGPTGNEWEKHTAGTTLADTRQHMLMGIR